MSNVQSPNPLSFVLCLLSSTNGRHSVCREPMIPRYNGKSVGQCQEETVVSETLEASAVVRSKIEGSATDDVKVPAFPSLVSIPLLQVEITLSSRSFAPPG